MVVAMIAMGMVQPAFNEIIHMVSMGNGGMSTVGAMHVFGRMPFRAVGALVRMRFINFDHMFIGVIPMHVMEMAVMQIIGVAIMPDADVPAARAVLVRMIFVFDGIAHKDLS